ncbi:uncharacterized protein PAC_18463 [Phialocephala subalpina]|uniref:Transcription factor domain-containing protein n=1 Tax=Phialocephala subalpina TaxID=576137 RepID=A0A1L7XU61_9HELO|nr:uncharacterized protein PAC_18463 [Phialocephala subalpina]
MHKDISAQTESYRKLIPGIEEVLIPVFLCLFELISRTTTAACFQHLAAAVQIIALRGPENCKDCLAQQMFRSMRVSEARISIFSGKPSVFAARWWRTLLFLGTEKPPLHRLVDIMLFIPLCLGLSGQEIPLLQQITNLATSSTREVGLQERTMQLLAEVQDWWTEYETSMRGVDPAPEYRSPYRADDEQPSFVFFDTFTALTVSMYNATTVILQTILHVLSIRDSPAFLTSDRLFEKSHLDHVLSHCTSILQISPFHEDQCPVGFDIMCGAFPLKIVAIMSPDLEQRAKAVVTISKWNGLGLSYILKSELGS